MTTTKFGLAQPVRRVEDPRLLKGDGRYTDDIVLPGMLHGVVLRSPHAAATIAAIDTAAAAALPGVARDLYRRRPERRRHRPAALRRAGANNRDGSDHGRAAASGAGGRRGAPCRRSGRLHRRRHASRQARDAAEAIAVDYDILPSDHRPGDRDGPGRAAGLAGGEAQPRVRLGDRRQGGDRRAVRQGRACHAADGGEQPHRRVLDGGARRAGRLRRGDRPLDAVCQHPGRLAGEEPDRRRCSAPSRRSSASSRPMSAAASA